MPPLSQAGLRLAVVGPTYPHKGGVAAHTTVLAHQLRAAGHEVQLIGWSRLYPARLYPGEQQLPPGGQPDVAPFPGARNVLSWARPDSWVRAGRGLRGVDAIVIVQIVPAVIPAHLALLRAAGAGGTTCTGSAPRAIAIAHNVLPHEGHASDRPLVRALYSQLDGVVVHSPAQQMLASQLGARRVLEIPLPPHLPGGPPQSVGRPPDAPTRLLALGLVRRYKGLDLLLHALRQVPNVTLTIAGEMWGDAGEDVARLAADPALADRVDLQPGYVPAEQIAPLLARHDVLALTYRSATASQNVLLAQRHGLVVLASAVGTFEQQVRDGTDGLLVPPADELALIDALRKLAVPEKLARLRAAVPSPDLTSPWASYVGGIEALAAPASEAATVDEPKGELANVPSAHPGIDEPGHLQLSGVRSELRRTATSLGGGALRLAEVVQQAALTAQPAVIDWRARWELHTRVRNGTRRRAALVAAAIRPTDVLSRHAEATGARAMARAGGLSWCRDEVAAWAALGALAAVLEIGDDGRRRAIVADASTTGSPFVRWASRAGFAPLELNDSSTSDGRLWAAGFAPRLADLPRAGIDVLTQLHPNDATCSSIEELLQSAALVLRRQGILVVTLAAGGHDAVTAADLRGIVARADNLGLSLVGKLDGEVTARLRRLAVGHEGEGPDTDAYALVRLTLRQRGGAR